MARMIPAEAKRLLSSCPQDTAFRCYNGELYWNLQDLAHALSSMGEAAFTHHVNEQKNDFATWVRDCIGDQVLAKSLWETRNQETTARRVAERVAFLEARQG